MASIEVIEVTTMLSGVDNSFVATNHPNVILYEVILGLGHISQIVSRMYLKYVKKIQDSNEIFTKYFDFCYHHLYIGFVSHGPSIFTE